MSLEENIIGGNQLIKAVEATDGFSGREIGKLMVALQSSLYSSDDGHLSRDMVIKVLKTKVLEHEQKRKMITSNMSRIEQSKDQFQSISPSSAIKRVGSAFHGASKRCDTMIDEVKQLF